MTDSFWNNWTYRLTAFKSGTGFVEMGYFSNSFDNCENTMLEACKRLSVESFGVNPAKGGGYTGTVIFTPSNKKEG